MAAVDLVVGSSGSTGRASGPESPPGARTDRPAELCLYEQLVAFFNDDNHGAVLADLLRHKDPVSLRLLDRFTSRWARFNRVRVMDCNGHRHDLYTAYKCALRSFHRQYFDPYARPPVIDFFVPSRALFVKTTVAQLNYVRWCIRYGVLDAYRETSGILENGE